MSEHTRAVIRCALILLMATTMLACSTADTPEESQSSDSSFDEAALRPEVAAAFDGYIAALNASDFDLAASYFADDPRFAWFEDGIQTYASRDDVRRSLEQLEAMGALSVTVEPARIVVLSADAALLDTTHTTVVGEPGAGFEFSGVMTVALVRTDTGWKFLQGHTSTPRALGQ